MIVKHIKITKLAWVKTVLDFLSLCDWLVVDTIPTAGEETERRESDRGKWCDRLTW